VTLGAHGLPLLYVVGLWFASTALVVWLDNRASRSFGSSLSVAGIFAVVGIAIIAVAARDVSVFAAYAAFTAAFLIWGWHEMSFLMGHYGPAAHGLPGGCSRMDPLQTVGANRDLP
jgi:putative photosynthetic complex assembly protein 2